ncbi:MAG: hypothetical protein JSW25_07010 [Thermoplasmata archaeon]|nr:MAG: hypothetical protein JSW25_07010 [Thermoplasmata archaeon]
MKNMHDDTKHGREMTPEQIGEILDVVSVKVPELLEKLSDILYSKENAQKYGEAVATFYKSMVDAGMEPAEAFSLTEKYMSSLSPLSALGGAFNKGSGEGNGNGFNIKID